ncbi:helix-hairpin-helix domain-containing protein [Myxococcota bacterium]|nr:helix-hairpin-helix domain-containing protein [Myxococcota bacterium]MBU1380819.1 helix-hairpin-helix domain-containing protein [Myxococcota bacterium]MBU1498953.1 helix-hairpin-helix domain-containing protein [Myxococcota bacterium]
MFQNSSSRSTIIFLLIAGIISALATTSAFAAKRKYNYEISGQVNINTAPASKLRIVPGIGKKKADLIIQYRAKKQFTNISELRKLRGFSAKMMSKIGKYLKTSGNTDIVKRRIPRKS